MKNYSIKKNVTLLSFTIICLFTCITACKKKETTTPDCPTDPIPVVTPDPTSVTDIDGNVYPVLKICGKLWMTENLRVTRYNDGSIIPTGLDDTNWSNTIAGAYSIYNNDPANNTTYGKLYNWFAVSTGKLAPTGWHVATEAEWKALIDCLGGHSIAGGKMKSTSTLWNTPNTGADNSSGFNGLPGGYRGTTGMYSTLGNIGYFWASTERNATQGEYSDLHNSTTAALSNGATKQFGYSIRCVKD